MSSAKDSPAPKSSPFRFETEKTHEEEKEVVRQRIERFRTRYRELAGETIKFDMVAYKEFAQRRDLSEVVVGHHPIGVDLGDEFLYKAELAISGIHSRIISGIDHRDKLCNAIAVSGRYAGDTDNGSIIKYSGAGGMSGKVQVADQEWEGPNLALRESCETDTPVKVVRCIFRESADGDTARRVYVYDGLYRVTKAERVKQDQYYVCLFELKGIEGEHIVSGRVRHSSPYSGSKNRRPLFIRKVIPMKRKQKSVEPTYGHTSGPYEIIQLEKEKAEFLRQRSGVLKIDISDGKEPILIPLIDDTGEDTEIPIFQYVTSLMFTTPAAQTVIEISRTVEAVYGCQAYRGRYYSSGFLMSTQPEGIRECPLSCLHCQNSIVGHGIRYPLEVFRTMDRGWGIRCSVDIPIGAFICEYTGEVMTDEEAESQIKQQDSEYLFSLDHFFEMRKRVLNGVEKDIDLDKLPKLPVSDADVKNDNYHGNFLVIDAKSKGNVGRFMNHACSDCANCTSQMVLLPGCNGVIHRVAFFACMDIPRFTEICNDYNWNEIVPKNLKCKCGKVNKAMALNPSSPEEKEAGEISQPASPMSTGA